MKAQEEDTFAMFDDLADSDIEQPEEMAISEESNDENPQKGKLDAEA